LPSEQLVGEAKAVSRRFGARHLGYHSRNFLSRDVPSAHAGEHGRWRFGSRRIRDNEAEERMSPLGQKAKYSRRAHIVCFAPESGLKTDIAGGPFRANSGHHVFGMSSHRSIARMLKHVRMIWSAS
jgi:hypothetical protein